MAIGSKTSLHQQTYALAHDCWIDLLAKTDNLLIIQDLDGVCMGLVKDPLQRVIDTGYVTATRDFDGHFYVLTNGEHVGQRGINGIIERAFGDGDLVKAQGRYLPGLAAGECSGKPGLVMWSILASAPGNWNFWRRCPIKFGSGWASSLLTKLAGYRALTWPGRLKPPPWIIWPPPPPT
jgi:hypothetical protein